MPIIGTPTGTAGNALAAIILSIRDQIPDPVTNAADDGNMFTLATLLRWINDAAVEIASAAPVIEDWYAISSEQGAWIYEVPSFITGVNQLWYDLWPCWRSAELDSLFVSKVQSRSYFFGPHSMGYLPKIMVWPAADRTAASTTLNGAITASATTINVTSATNFKSYGFAMIEDELIQYQTLAGNQMTQVLRGVAGTTAVAHTSLTAITERNIFFKCTRLPVTVTASTDVFELPLAFHPLVELSVLANVRQAEQEFGEARQLRAEFDKAVEKLAQKGAQKGLRQGLQVRTEAPGPLFFGGRVYIP